MRLRVRGQRGCEMRRQGIERRGGGHREERKQGRLTFRRLQTDGVWRLMQRVRLRRWLLLMGQVLLALLLMRGSVLLRAG